MSEREREREREAGREGNKENGCKRFGSWYFVRRCLKTPRVIISRARRASQRELLQKCYSQSNRRASPRSSAKCRVVRCHANTGKGLLSCEEIPKGNVSRFGNYHFIS